MKKSAIVGMAIAAALPAMAQTAATDTIRAHFPGGEEKMAQYIEANRKYPQAAMQNGIEGVVGVQFIVKTDGTREQLTIVRLIDPDLEGEAIRLVNAMPLWIPAYVGEMPVDSRTSVQIPFILP